MDKKGGLEDLNAAVISRGLCAACGACVGGCPYVVSFRGRTVVMDKCSSETGTCFVNCPMTFFDQEAVSRAVFSSTPDPGEMGAHRIVRASRAGDEAVCSAGQGGGTVTALMTTALAAGIIDAAVLTGKPAGEEFPRGIVATSREEIVATAGSKFVGAHSLAALREAVNRGFTRIGVVGLPCQVRSVRKMALYDARKEDLNRRITLVVGLFCNWALSAREFTGFVADRVDLSTVEGYDIPPPPAGVLQVHSCEGHLNIPLDDVRPLIQEACGVCPDMTAEYADLSVGMYEGRPGWNTLVERTPAGAALVERAIFEGALAVEEFPQENLSHLKAASLNKRKRAVAT